MEKATDRKRPPPEDNPYYHRPYKHRVVETDRWKYKIAHMKGNGLKYLTEKKMTTTDVSTQHCRLLFTTSMSESLKAMMTVSEEAAVSLGEDGIPVRVIDIFGTEYPMTLKKWANKAFNLITGWRRFMDQHRIKEGDVVWIWGFRAPSLAETAEDDRVEKQKQLCLMLKVLKKTSMERDHKEEHEALDLRDELMKLDLRWSLRLPSEHLQGNEDMVLVR